MASKYYQENREKVLKQSKERYWKRKLEGKDVTLEKENKTLRKRIDALQEKVEYYQQRARVYKHQRTEANQKVKNLQEQLKNSVPKQTGANYNKTVETIKKLEELLKNTNQPKILYRARLEQLNSLKESIGVPIHMSCAFGIN